MAGLLLKNITKIYDGGVKAVDNFNLEVQDKEFIIFVGPSGCGKSTTLRMIAGLEEISDGELYIDGKKMNDVLPKDRDIAMVFQNYALYAHMTVFENMAFSLQLKKVPKEEIKKKVIETAKILDLENLLDRKPKALSGGQRQRVALGRAIVRNPKVFLMDEPLSNLDAKLRVQMRTEITKLYHKLGTTIIYVTHDQVEAMTMGTRIVVMNQGVIQQVASADELYNNPDNLFVATFIGSPQMNILSMDVSEENGLIKLSSKDVSFCIGGSKAKLLKDNGYVGKTVLLGIRPEHIHYVTDDSIDATVAFVCHKYSEGTDKIIKATKFDALVDVVEMLGAEKLIHINLNGANVVTKADTGEQITMNSTASFIIDTEAIHLFDVDSKKVIR